MSVVGIDYGSSSCTMAVVRRGGIDIVQNQVSSRQTASIVGFTEKQRALGEAGRTQALRNVKNTILWPKKLIGRPFCDPRFREELQLLSGARWSESKEGTAAATVTLRDEQHTFIPEQINAMLIGELKKTCESSTGVPMADVCCSVPGYWTSKQRRALIDAGKIAGVNIIGVINDTTAAAVNWGFYRTDITAARKVVFVTMGASNFSASLVEFTPNQAVVLSAGQDVTLGGDEVDLKIAELFAQRFQEKNKKNIKENQRAWFRLIAGVEKVKKNLNENESASCGIECVVEDRDLNERLTKDEFIGILKSLNAFDRLSKVLDKLLQDAGVTKEQVDDVEWFGSGLLISPFRDHITQYFGGKRLSNTMNAEEAVAKGCALYCAFLSPLFKVRDYKVVDIARYPITISWKTLFDSADTEEKSAELFPVKEQLGKTKTITFTRPNAKPFEFTIKYSDPTQIPLPSEKDGIIGVYRVTKIPKEADPAGQIGDADVKVKIRLDANGTVTVIGADLVEKKEYTVEVPIEEPKKEEKKDEKKEEKKDGEHKDGEQGDKMEGVEPTSPPSPAPSPAPAAAATRQEKRTKTITTALSVEPSLEQGLPAATIISLRALEAGMAAKDNEAIEQSNAKNALETFIYNTRDKLGNTWAEFAQESENAKLNKHFEDTEEWLYGDGADVETSVYKKKLGEMTSIADPIALRASEWDTLPGAVAALLKTTADLKAEATSGKEQYAHISPEDLNKVVSDAEHVIANLNENGKMAAFEKRKKTDNPPFRTSDINARNQNLSSASMKILTKPKPAPKVEEKKPEEKKADEKKPEEKKADDKAQDKKDGDGARSQETPAGEAGPKADPMDTAD